MTIRCETCSEEWFPGHTCPQVEQDVEIKPDKNVTLGELREAEDFEAAYVQEEERIKQCIDDFRPHEEDCTCNGCLQSIINKQAWQMLEMLEQMKKQQCSKCGGSMSLWCDKDVKERGEVARRECQVIIDQQASQIKQYQELHETMKAKVIQADETTAYFICRLNELLCDIVNR